MSSQIFLVLCRFTIEATLLHTVVIIGDIASRATTLTLTATAATSNHGSDVVSSIDAPELVHRRQIILQWLELYHNWSLVGYPNGYVIGVGM